LTTVGATAAGRGSHRFHPLAQAADLSLGEWLPAERHTAAAHGLTGHLLEEQAVIWVVWIDSHAPAGCRHANQPCSHSTGLEIQAAGGMDARGVTTRLGATRLEEIFNDIEIGWAESVFALELRLAAEQDEENHHEPRAIDSSIQ